MNKVEIDEDFYIFDCPNCQNKIIVNKNDTNCKIFRHGVYKKNYQQINPHSSLKDCQNFILNNLIFGCSKPFKLIDMNDGLYVDVCDYI